MDHLRPTDCFQTLAWLQDAALEVEQNLFSFSFTKCLRRSEIKQCLNELQPVGCFQHRKVILTAQLLLSELFQAVTSSGVRRKITILTVAGAGVGGGA